MAGIQSFARKHLTTLLLLLLAGGFAVILGELILYKHYEGVQLIGFVSTVGGLVFVLWGVVARGGVRVTLASLLVLLSIAGIVGVFEHSEGDEEGAQRPAPIAATAANLNISNGAPFVAQDSGETATPSVQGPRDSRRTPPPPLAPLGLSGLALMGAVTLFAKRDNPNGGEKKQV